MTYKLKKGVVLLKICSSYFVFPTRSSGFRIQMLFPVSDKTAEALMTDGNQAEEPVLCGKDLKRIRQLGKYGLLREKPE